MRIPRKIGLSLATLAIASAFILLGVLILLSTSPVQESHRRLDAALEYLISANEAVSRSLNGGIAQHVSVIKDLESIKAGITQVSINLEGAYSSIYTPSDWTNRTRAQWMNWFSGTNTRQDQSYIYERFVVQKNQLLESIGSSAPSQNLYVDSHREFESGIRNHVRNLRERGKTNEADELYRSGQQLIERATGGTQRDFVQIDQIIDRLYTLAETLSIADRLALNELLDQALLLADARQEINDLKLAMGLPVFARTLGEFRDATSADYISTLNYINEARILLNVFTALLVLVLGYFGFRLQRSYTALNRSHDDLELRVDERTVDLQQALENLKESQVQLVQAEKMSSLGQLVAGVMHEINTPLLYVLNNTTLTTEMIKDIAAYMDATLPIAKARTAADAQEAMKSLLEQQEFLGVEFIEENMTEIATLSVDSIDGLNQISELVQSLKDFSRLDRAEEDRFDVQEGIEKTLLMTRNVLKYGIEVKTDFSDVESIYCVPSRINQVFINLISNAAQAMDGEGSLTIATRQIKDWVEISFQDTGCGIAQENIDKILDPFFTTKPVGQGTGLGLSIVHKIINEHNGQLLIDSEEGVGTRMTIGLPVNGRSSQADTDTDADHSEEAA